MPEPNAWLLDLGHSMRAAIGSRELVQIVENPVLHAVPLTPDHARHVLIWQKHLVPVISLSMRVAALAADHSLVALVAYQEVGHHVPKLGAAFLASPPRRIEVSDAQATAQDDCPAGVAVMNNFKALTDRCPEKIGSLGGLGVLAANAS